MSTYLTLADATKIAPVSQRTLWRAIRRGDLRASKPGGKWIIREDHLTEWIEGSPVAVDPMPTPKRSPATLLERVLEKREEAAA